MCRQRVQQSAGQRVQPVSAAMRRQRDDLRDPEPTGTGFEGGKQPALMMRNEAALVPIIFEGISAAYCISEQGVDELHQRIQRADRKKIADGIYYMLSDQVGGYDLSLSKNLVSEERFQQLV